MKFIYEYQETLKHLNKNSNLEVGFGPSGGGHIPTAPQIFGCVCSKKVCTAK